MNKYFIYIFILFIFFSCKKDSEFRDKKISLKEKKEFKDSLGCVPGVSIVEFDENMAQKVADELKSGVKVYTRSSDFKRIKDEFGIISMRRLFPYAGKYEIRAKREGMDRWYVIEYDKRKSLTRAKSEFSSIPGVVYVEDVRKIRKTINFPNDEEILSQWYIYNSNNIPEVKKNLDINILPVWQYYTSGSSNVVVAVMDEGIQLNHEDLVGATLPVGDNGSKNFVVSGKTNINAGNHGTHVAGTIGAITNNGIGVAGIAGGDAKNGIAGVKLMSCEIMWQKSETELKNGDAESSYYWAANNGAVISQNSWGYVADYNGDGTIDADELNYYKREKAPRSLVKAINYFIKYAGCDNYGRQLDSSPVKGGLVVFAAGNDNVSYGVPAYLDQVIAVGAIGLDGSRAYFSNYGPWVDIAAPGMYIYNTVTNNKYDYMSGTSMACPQVSGVAALVLSKCGRKGFTSEMLRKAIIKGANKSFLPDNTIGPMLDALGALVYSTKDFPKQPKFTFKLNKNRIDFVWKVSENSKHILAKSYIIVVSKNKNSYNNIETDNLPSDLIYKKIDVPENGVKAGAEMKGFIEGLEYGESYYVSVLDASYSHYYDSIPVIKKIEIVGNHLPVLTISPNNNIRIEYNKIQVLNISVSDRDNDDVSLSYSPKSEAYSLNKVDNNQYEFRINPKKIGKKSNSIIFTATDSQGGVASQQINYEVFKNHNPVIKINYSEPIYLKTDQTITIPITVSDKDNDIIKMSYSKMLGIILQNIGNNRYNIIIDGSKISVGRHIYTIIATDIHGGSTKFKLNFEVQDSNPKVITNVNMPITLMSYQSIDIPLIIQDVKIEDLKVTYSQVVNGLTLTKTDELHYNLRIDGNSISEGSYIFNFTIESKSGKTYTLPIKYDIIQNTPPVIRSDYKNKIKIKSNEKVAVSISISDQDDFTISHSQLGKGLTLRDLGDNFYELIIQGSKYNVGNHTFSISATDKGGLKSTLNIDYEVIMNKPPVITLPEGKINYSYVASRFYNIPVNVSDEDGDKLILGFVNNLPWVSIKEIGNNQYNLIVNTGSPDIVYNQLYSIRLKLDDGAGNIVYKDINVKVHENHPPQIYISPQRDNISLKSYQSFDYNIYVTDSDYDKIDVKHSNDVKGAELEFQENSRYIFHIDASQLQPGNYKFWISATDEGGLTTKRQINYTILQNHPPIITPSVEGVIQIKGNQSGKVILKVNDVDEDRPIVISHSDLREGLIFKELGSNYYELDINAISIQPGHYQFTMSATDPAGATASYTVNYDVLENHAPEVIKPLKNILLIGNNAVEEIDLSKYFEDIDGDNIIYEAISNESYISSRVNGNMLYVSSEHPGKGEVYVLARDWQGKEVRSQFIVVDTDKEDLFAGIYPNPVKDNLYIRTGDTAQITTIKIISQTGNVVYEKKISVSAFEPLKINVANLSSGRYVVEVGYNGKTIHRNIIKR